jgi:hypothetical protein
VSVGRSAQLPGENISVVDSFNGQGITLSPAAESVLTLRQGYPFSLRDRNPSYRGEIFLGDGTSSPAALFKRLS